MIFGQTKQAKFEAEQKEMLRQANGTSHYALLPTKLDTGEWLWFHYYYRYRRLLIVNGFNGNGERQSVYQFAYNTRERDDVIISLNSAVPAPITKG